MQKNEWRSRARTKEFLSRIPPSFCLEETGRTKYQNERKRGARRRKKISLGLPLLIPALRKQIEQNSRTKEREEEEQKKFSLGLPLLIPALKKQEERERTGELRCLENGSHQRHRRCKDGRRTSCRGACVGVGGRRNAG